jgi:hypothetical protein
LQYQLAPAHPAIGRAPKPILGFRIQPKYSITIGFRAQMKDLRNSRILSDLMLRHYIFCLDFHPEVMPNKLPNWAPDVIKWK